MLSSWRLPKKLLFIFPFLLLYLLFITRKSTIENYRSTFLGNRIETRNSSQISHVHNEFLIDTVGCKISHTDTTNNKLEPLLHEFHKKIQKPYCEVVNNGDVYRPPLVASDENSLFLVNNSKKFYSKEDEDDIKCSYTPFWKEGADDLGSLTFGKKIDFIGYTIVPPTEEFVLVECFVDGRSVYKDAHSFVHKKISSPKNSSNTKPQINVFIFGMDGVSRVNYHRQLSLTENLIKDDFIEYYGYNKLADNTFPNLIPFLTGYSVEELRSVCWPYKSAHFDDCPIIWKKYKESGYTTAYFEEQSHLALFNFERNGFLKPPTDYYYHQFDLLASRKIAHTYLEAVNLCLGSRFSSEVLLNHASKFVSTMKNQTTFTMVWEVGFSHDDLNLPKIGDPLHVEFFTKLKQHGWFNTSAIVFMSDHGIRYGKILETDEGYIEERLPLFKVSFPTWFAERYPLAYGNFVNNSRRLTTHFDAHEMLDDLNTLDVIEDDSIRDRTSRMSSLDKLPRGISLFLPIPETRTCEQAGIPNNYCTCLQTSDDESVNTAIARNTALFLVKHINNMLKEFPQCKRLRLKEVKKMKSAAITKISKKYALITIVTKPGNGLFEAMVAYNVQENTQFTLIGTISRLNPYGNRSSCMHQPKLKLYCDCRNQTTTSAESKVYISNPNGLNGVE